MSVESRGSCLLGDSFGHLVKGVLVDLEIRFGCLFGDSFEYLVKGVWTWMGSETRGSGLGWVLKQGGLDLQNHEGLDLISKSNLF